MKIILAFDSFKGCMSAHEACSIAAKAIQEINSKTEIVEMPLSDGGEGLTKCIQKIIPTSTMAFYPGAGAAGGLGYALLTYLKAELKSGIDIVLDNAERGCVS